MLKRKKLLAALLAGTMMLSLVGCGKKADTSGDTTDTTDTANTTNTTNTNTTADTSHATGRTNHPSYTGRPGYPGRTAKNRTGDRSPEDRRPYAAAVLDHHLHPVSVRTSGCIAV